MFRINVKCIGKLYKCWEHEVVDKVDDKLVIVILSFLCTHVIAIVALL